MSGTESIGWNREEEPPPDQQYIQQVLAHSADAALVVVPDSGVVYASPAIARVLGFEPGEMVGKLAAEWVHPDELASVLYHRRAASRLGHSGPVEIRGIGSDGTERWFEAEWWRADPAVADADGAVVMHLRDASDRREARTAALRSEARLARLMRSAADVVLIVNLDQSIDYMSPSVERILGWQARSGHVFRHTEVVHPDDRERFGEVIENLMQSPQAKYSGEVRVRHRDGQYRWMEVTGQNLTADPYIGGIVLHFHDVTDRHVAEDARRRGALTDDLTGLANRTLLRDRLDQALRRAEDSAAVAVLVCDIDGFGALSDALGHARGDDILREVGNRLAHLTYASVVVARMGSDEFALVIDNVKDFAFTAIVADAIRATLNEPFVIAGVEHRLTCSIGIAVGEPEIGGDGMLRDAGVALHTAKSAGANHVELFNQDLRERVERRVEMRGALAAALSAHEFVLHYQPEFDVATGRIVGTEALIRWDRAGHGLQFPGAFIPDAEANGMIVEIGAWVVGEAAEAARRLEYDNPAAPRTMWVNASAHQLVEDGFADYVLAELWRVGLSPSAFGFEVTESVFLETNATASRNFMRLREAGCRLALDDFGTGYSSLTYLQRFRVDAIKIDQSFVAALDAEGDENTAPIVAVVNNLGRALGLRVIAEGVETEAQLAYLAAIQCSKVSGFGLCRPVPESELAEVLTRDLFGVRAAMRGPH
ncbi:MAG: putative bifunctional diguanylate cyclase/phosphodiesterase [Acidimicrobiia bacterium]